MSTTATMVKRGVQGIVALLAMATVMVVAPSAWACSCGGPFTPPITSTGVGTETQTVVLTPPDGGFAEMLDEYGDPVTDVDDYSGFGSYHFDAATNTISFTPVLGYVGSPNPSHLIQYRLTDSLDRSNTNTYTWTVVAPPGPTPPALSSTGIIDQPQSANAPVPQASELSRIRLLDDGNTTKTVTVAGQGTYTLDSATGVITFTPEPGYVGTPTPVAYRYTDAYGQSADSTYSPVVTQPPAPAAPPLSSTGNQGAPQSLMLPIPPGGTVTLLDGSGNPVSTLAVAGQGTYVLDPSSGLLTFQPIAGFSGDAAPVAYRVTDQYGQQAEGNVSVHVLGAELTAPVAAPSTAARPSSGTLPTTGTSTVPLLASAGLLLLAGAALVLGARHRAKG